MKVVTVKSNASTVANAPTLAAALVTRKVDLAPPIVTSKIAPPLEMLLPAWRARVTPKW